MKQRIQRAIVNAGGDISVIGSVPTEIPGVGVQNPNDPSQISWVIPLQNNSVHLRLSALLYPGWTALASYP